MFWLGSFVGYVIGSFVTCAVFYFCFRVEQNKKAEIQRRMLDKLAKKEMEQLKGIKND